MPHKRERALFFRPENAKYPFVQTERLDLMLFGEHEYGKRRLMVCSLGRFLEDPLMVRTQGVADAYHAVQQSDIRRPAGPH
jgi:hypothetical protein